MPLSEKAADLIIQHVDLLEGEGIEQQLLQVGQQPPRHYGAADDLARPPHSQLVAHVSAYKVILKRWEDGHLQVRTVHLLVCCVTCAASHPRFGDIYL